MNIEALIVSALKNLKNDSLYDYWVESLYYSKEYEWNEDTLALIEKDVMYSLFQ